MNITFNRAFTLAATTALAGTLAGTLATYVSQAHAQEVLLNGAPVVGSPNITAKVDVSGTNTLNVGSGASIAVAADDAVVASSGTVTVINDGTITSNSGFGVSADGAIISLTNSGTISGELYGVVATTITSLTNNGTISAVQRNGVHGTSTITSLINSGTISGQRYGVVANGIIASLTNSGTISGQSEGVFANGEIISLTNSGLISSGTGANSAGIDMNFGTVINSGTITGNTGIEADRLSPGGTVTGNTSITNSGTISSTQGASGLAIDLQGVGVDTINLNAGSVLIGTIEWDGTDDTLNLGKGLDTEVTLSNAAANVNFGTGVGINNGTTIVQVDVSGASLAGNHGSDIAQAIGGAVNARTSSTRGNRYGNTSNGVGYSLADGSVEHSLWGSLWAAGSKQDASGTVSAASSTSVGATSGIDWLDAEGNLLGFYGGVGTGRVSVDVKNGQTIDTQSYVGGIYGSKTNDNFVFDFNISAGMINFDSTRRVSTNNGIQTAKASYEGVLFAPKFTISREIDAGFTRSIGFGYTGLFLDGYTETGSSASNITMGSRSIHYATAKAQVEFNKDITNDDGKTTMFRPYLGLEGKAGFGDVNTGTITVAGSTLNFDTGSAKNTARGFAGANFSKTIAENTKFFGNVEVGYNSNKSFDGRVSLGLSKTF